MSITHFLTLFDTFWHFLTLFYQNGVGCGAWRHFPGPLAIVEVSMPDGAKLAWMSSTSTATKHFWHKIVSIRHFLTLYSVNKTLLTLNSVNKTLLTLNSVNNTLFDTFWHFLTLFDTFLSKWRGLRGLAPLPRPARDRRGVDARRREAGMDVEHEHCH